MSRNVDDGSPDFRGSWAHLPKSRTGNFFTTNREALCADQRNGYLPHMAKPDFSHYQRVSPANVVKSIERGEQPTDDMFVKAIAEISPPLLDCASMKCLVRELDPQAERRGRRAKGSKSRLQLAEMIRNVSRSDLAKEFLEGLADRLESGIRFSEAKRSFGAHLKFERIRAGMLASGIYRDLRDLIKPDASCVTHPILGTFKIEDQRAPLRDKALSITNDLLRRAGYLKVISNDRLKNFISEYDTGKLHRFS